jgi:CBS domain-containing protein
VKVALTTMKRRQLRRLPVVDQDGRPLGIISMNDVVLHASNSPKATDIPADDVLDTFKAISAHARPLAVPA